MSLSLLFFVNSAALGAGLAMDAFSVSLANGLNEPGMPASRVVRIAGTFGIFQTAMPLIGWLCIHTIAEEFEAFRKFIPWIALALLLFIGIRMILEGIRNKKEEEKKFLRGRELLVQGIATSIDALSVGFTIAEYTWPLALAEALVIGTVTFGICAAGVHLGRKLGARVERWAPVIGGAILVLIGIEIFISGSA